MSTTSLSRAICQASLIVLLFSLQPVASQAGAFERLFAPKAELWPKWQAHQPDSQKQIDHSAWDRFLQKYVQAGADGINRLPYAAISATERQSLLNYIDAMQAISISHYSRRQQMAYWINLYNAVTINIILQHYPVSSIRDIDISPGLFADGPWDKKLLKIEGQEVSLNDIEHRILRPIWQDPRIHYGVNCASLGCPNLQARAYTAEQIEPMLNAAARAYVNHPRGVRVQGEDVFVSSIYSWFQEDFGKTEADVIRHIQDYAESGLANKLNGIVFLAGDDYDWTLNDSTSAKNNNE
jgi:hypothetical protein